MTYEHSLDVAITAEVLCEAMELDATTGYTAGLLHDSGGIYPVAQRVAAAEQAGIALVEEERQVPLLIHQRQSRVIAVELFGVKNPVVLSAIECHTTLKASYTTLDMLVFLADKISWDQAGTPPFLNQLLTHLQQDSLEMAAWYYLDEMIRGPLLVLHPWAAQARDALESQIQRGSITTLKQPLEISRLCIQ